jgi:hypothetical protein
MVCQGNRFDNFPEIVFIYLVYYLFKEFENEKYSRTGFVDGCRGSGRLR